jgi:hypothetical protein
MRPIAPPPRPAPSSPRRSSTPPRAPRVEPGRHNRAEPTCYRRAAFCPLWPRPDPAAGARPTRRRVARARPARSRACFSRKSFHRRARGCSPRSRLRPELHAREAELPDEAKEPPPALGIRRAPPISSPSSLGKHGSWIPRQNFARRRASRAALTSRRWSLSQPSMPSTLRDEAAPRPYFMRARNRNSRACLNDLYNDQ